MKIMNKFNEIIEIVKWLIQKVASIGGKKYFYILMMSVFFSFLPAIALRYQQLLYNNIINKIDSQYSDANMLFHQMFALCVILILAEVITLFNQGILREVLYDDFNLGMENELMNVVGKVPITNFFHKEFMDKFYFTKFRYTAFTGVLSDILLLCSVIVQIISLLLLAWSYSLEILIFSIVYVGISILLNIAMAHKTDFDYVKYRKNEMRTRYYEQNVMKPGVAKEIRLYDSQQSIAEEWEEAYASIKRMEERVGVWKGISEFICGFGYFFFTAIMLLFAVKKVGENVISPDVVIILYYLFQNVSLVIKSSSGNFQRFSRDIKDLVRIKEFFDKSLDVDENVENIVEKEFNRDSREIITVKNVSFCYNEALVLKDISFSIKEGETIALLGKNGSGKSTLIKLIMGLYSPLSGNIFYKGVCFKNINPLKIKNMFGVFFQDGKIFHATLQENVGIGSIDEMDNIDMVSEALKKSRFAKTKDINQWILRDVRNDGIMLSGGEKQKLGIARAYMGNKEILVFDEPASALDPVAEKKQFEAIKKEIGKATSILISHRVGFAKLADKIIVLDKGCVCEYGTHEELLQKSGVYAEMYMTQKKWYQG